MSDIFSDDVLASIDGAIDQSMTLRTFGVGEIIGGRFKVERTVGRGNFGFVYRVKDTEKGKTRALKTFYEKLTSRPGVADNLRQLGHALSQTSHPNLVRVLEVGQDGELLYFVEDFCSAMTLDRLVSAVRKNAPEQGFPADEMDSLVHQVGEALAQLPDLPHGGLNPQNIFMSKQGVKVADLGVLGACLPALTRQDWKVLSSRDFCPPEVFEVGATVTPSADVFSLGRLLHFLLTLGQPPLPETTPVLRGPHSPLLLDVARDAADFDPALRHRDIAEFVAAYEAGRTAPADYVPDEVIAEEDQLAAAVESATEALAKRLAGDEEEYAELPDLEHAELPWPEAEPALAEELVEKLPTPPTAEKRPFPVGLLVAAAVVVALVVVFIHFLPKPTTPTPTPVTVAQLDTDTFDLEGITLSPEPGGPTFDEMLGALLVQAETYLKANRLTDPPEDSAFGLYTFVLEIDPGNKPAKEGVGKVEDYYLKYGRAFMTSKKYDRADWMFRKVLFVNDQNKEATRTLAKIATLKAPTVVAIGPKPGPTEPPTKPGPTTTPEPTAIAKPTVPATAPGAVEKMTADIIRATIGNYMGRVKFCFAKSPDAAGVVKVSFVINPNGQVSGARVASSSMGNADVEQCLVRRVAVMKFPAFSGSSKNVTFPFRFNQ